MISIVMPVWNRKKLVIETIESVLAQTYKDFEFIIVDDGSTDGIVEIIEEYAKKDDRIILLKQKHSGSTDAWNKGFKIMKGNIVCILGSDDLWIPRKLERQIEVAKRYPDYILHNYSISIDEKGNEIVKATWYDYTPKECKVRALGEASVWFMTSSWFIPKKIFDKVGLFEGVYNDYQWIMRAILLHDVKMKLIPEFLTKHRSTENSNTFKFIGLKKFRELAEEIQKTIVEKMGVNKVSEILSSSEHYMCMICKGEIPEKCPKCGINLRKKENLICGEPMVPPNHCYNCWRKEQ